MCCKSWNGESSYSPWLTVQASNGVQDCLDKPLSKLLPYDSFAKHQLLDWINDSISPPPPPQAKIYLMTCGTLTVLWLVYAHVIKIYLPCARQLVLGRFPLISVAVHKQTAKEKKRALTKKACKFKLKAVILFWILVPLYYKRDKLAIKAST